MWSPKTKSQMQTVLVSDEPADAGTPLPSVAAVATDHAQQKERCGLAGRTETWQRAQQPGMAGAGLVSVIRGYPELCSCDPLNKTQPVPARPHAVAHPLSPVALSGETQRPEQ